MRGCCKIESGAFGRAGGRRGKAFAEVLKQQLQLGHCGEQVGRLCVGLVSMRRGRGLQSASAHAARAAQPQTLTPSTHPPSCCCAVPLLIGHGGNTGSQSNATVIRALALGHLRASDWLMVVYKVRAEEAAHALGGRCLHAACTLRLEAARRCEPSCCLRPRCHVSLQPPDHPPTPPNGPFLDVTYIAVSEAARLTLRM